MDERKVHIDEFFARQMADKPEAPPPYVWDALDKRLDAASGRKKPFPVWWFWAISVLVILSATGIIAGLTGNTPVDLTVQSQQQAPAVPSAVTPQANDINRPADAVTTEQSSTRESAHAPSTHETENTAPTTKTVTTTTTISDNNQPPAATAVETPATVRPVDKARPVAHHGVSNMPVQDVATSTQVAKPYAAVPNQHRTKEEHGILPVNNHSQTIQSLTPSAPAVASVAALPEAKPVLPENDGEPVQALTPIKPSGDKLYSMPKGDLLASAKRMPLPGIQSEINTNELTPQLTEVTPPSATTAMTDEKRSVATADTPRKKQHKDTTAKPIADVDKKVKKKITLPIEIGMKAGYSMGFDKNWHANKVAFAPYISYRMPVGVSFIFQPTYHTGNAKTGSFDNGEQSYYRVNSSSFDSTGRVVRGVIDSTVVTANPPDTVYRTYTYTQRYDSIHVRYGVQQNRLWDIELPLIVKYEVSKNFSVLVGGSATYSSILQTEVKEQTFAQSKEYVDHIAPETFYVTYQGQKPPTGPARKSFDDLFNYSGTPYANYSPRQPSVSKNFMRYGFMIGASANVGDHWMVDVMLHKTGVDTKAVPDKELQKIYTQSYLRVMIGYKLFKSKGLK